METMNMYKNFLKYLGYSFFITMALGFFLVVVSAPSSPEKIAAKHKEACEKMVRIECIMKITGMMKNPGSVKYLDRVVKKDSENRYTAVYKIKAKNSFNAYVYSTFLFKAEVFNNGKQCRILSTRQID